MRKSRLWKRFCIIAFALLILILFFFGYDRINQKYPQAAVEIVGMEEPIETDGVEMLVKNAHFYTTEELERLQVPEEIIYSDGLCMITFEVQIKNVSGESKKVEAAYRRIETLGWSGGVGLHALAYFYQDNMQSVFELADQETRSINLAFPIIPRSFTKKDWEHIQEKQYYYVLSFYPTKKMIRLQFT